MRFLIFIGFLSLIYSCSENKGQPSSINQYIEPIISDSIIDIDSVPVYRKIMDEDLASGFEFPLRIIGGNNFKYEWKTDTDFTGGISTYIEFNSRFLKPVGIVAPAKGMLWTYETEGLGKHFSFKNRFFENGEIYNVIIEISGMDSVVLHPEDKIDLQKFENYGVIGYLLPGKSDTKKRLRISISIDEGEMPFYFSSVQEFFKEYKKCIVPSNLDKLVLAHKSK